MDTITITQDQLKRALQTWEQAYRDGKTISHAEADKLSPETIAVRSTAYLWSLLSGTAS